MAFTASQTTATVWGNKLVKVLNVTADANSGAVTTGLGVVEWVQVAVVSAATGSQKFKANLSAASAALPGSIFMSSCTNGDTFTVVAIGH